MSRSYVVMDQVYEGLDEIAALFKISPRTAQRWIYEHGMPACKKPNGVWIITNSMIDKWILARNKVYMEQYKKKKQSVS